MSWWRNLLWLPESMAGIRHSLNAIHYLEREIMTAVLNTQSDVDELQAIVDHFADVVEVASTELKTLADGILELRGELAGGQLGPQIAAIKAKAQAAVDKLAAAELAAEGEVAVAPAVDNAPSVDPETPPEAA